MNDLSSSTPNLSGFDPKVIPYQYQVIKDVRKTFDYSMGVHEILLSGSVGSAKSILMAHLALTHCLFNPGARICLGRKSMVDLKATIYNKIIEHIGEDLVEGVDYQKNDSQAKIQFRNGSEIISRSWADKRYKKGRSLELSGLIVEELTENNDEDKEAYDELRMRVGRLPHVKENFAISATNPDSPAHWAYKYFITSDKKTRHVYYSVTTDNPFLPSWYIDQLEQDLDPKMARRMIYGEWLEIAKDTVYYAYERDVNFRNEEYKIDPRVNINLSFDFNISLGKPMSAIAGQYLPYKDEFHYFREFIVEGADVFEIMAEIGNSGVLDIPVMFTINGDATGGNKAPQSKASCYQQIKQFLDEFRTKDGRKVRYQMKVGKSNPPILKRHQMVNSYCKNAKGQHRLFLYKDCTVADEGMRLTALKKGASVVEDDSKHFQHVTTSIGYDVVSTIKHTKTRPPGNIGR